MAVTPQTAATFNGAQPLDGDNPYVDVTLSAAYSSASAYGVQLSINLTDASSGIPTISIKASSKSTTGFRILASDQWSGTVEITTWDK